jgi:3',5'-cyclic AMP phosphodiesterase CpdA
VSSRFVILSDTHCLSPTSSFEVKPWWNRALEMDSAGIGEAVVRAVSGLQPDFVIHCGDLTSDGSLESYMLATSLLDRLPCPWYAVPGNHDTETPGIRAALAARFGLADDQCHYTRDLAGLRFVFLDVAYWAAADGCVTPYRDESRAEAGLSVGPGEWEWLDRELTAADRLVVVVSHAPLGHKPDYAVASLPRGRRPAGPRTSVASLMGDLAGREKLRAVLRRHPIVRLALAGHWHIHDVTLEDGITFCQTAALREYPFEFRLATRNEDRLHITTLGLHEPDAQRLRAQSYVEAWGNAWVAGTEADRMFTVELNPPDG